MFEIEAARITAAGVSFQLPSGFALLEAQEPHVNSTLEIQSPDSSYTVAISLDLSTKASAGELRSILSEGCYRILQPISPIQCGSLHGHQVTYLSGKRGCCEIRLDLIPNDPHAPNTLVVEISTHWGRSIETFCSSPAMTTLLQSFQSA